MNKIFCLLCIMIVVLFDFECSQVTTRFVNLPAPHLTRAFFCVYISF